MFIKQFISACALVLALGVSFVHIGGNQPNDFPTNPVGINLLKIVPVCTNGCTPFIPAI
jgi:hypothetical protein